MAIKINRTLYVGIGGTGVKILTKVKRHFMDAYGEVPPMIGFLSIDTQAGSADTAAVKLGSGLNKDVRLDPNEICGVTVNNALEVYQSNQSYFAYIPQPPCTNINTLSAIKNAGAGQVRSNGCFIARYNRKTIETSLRGALSRVTGPVPVNSNYEIGLGNNNTPAKTTINVICSMSGGTGSGMLLDVLCVVKELARNCGQKCDIIPWVIMPDIFKSIAPTGSFNVFYNTYGALRDLDFVYQCCNTKPIPFGNTQINQRPFEFAYLINNVNSAGTTFRSMSDIEDDVAKCAFLPSGDMGTAADEMKDNVIASIPMRAMGGKEAWAASVSAAELVYDSDMMGQATIYAIGEQLAASLLNTNKLGSALCDNFVDDPNVKIRENGGSAHDDVIDYICDIKQIGSSFAVDKATTADDIVAMINLIDRDQKPDANYVAKLKNTRLKLQERLCELICEKGGLSAAALFLDSMEEYVDVCAGEMSGEIKELGLRLEMTKRDWDSELKGCRSFGDFFFSEDQAEVVSEKVKARMRDLADMRRHRLAASFFAELKKEVVDYKRLVDTKKEQMADVAAGFSGRLNKLRAECKPKSEFQIFLHSVSNVKVEVTQGMWNTFGGSAAMPTADNLTDWLKDGPVGTSKAILDFAKDTQPARDAFNYSIEDKLKDMQTNDIDGLRRNIEALMERAKPMWVVDYHGLNTAATQRSLQILVGVSDKENSIMKTDKGIVDLLTINQSEPIYANAGKKDRIYLMMQESSAPVFAVNNFKTYEAEFKDRQSQEGGLSCSVDCSMDSLREAMRFRMWPAEKPQVSLDMWTQAFCFNADDGQPIVRFDKDGKQYWIMSRQYGDSLKNYRYDLGPQRDIAFKQFETSKLYDEVKTIIDDLITKNGKKFVDDRLEYFRGTGNIHYLDECVFGNCSPEEEDGIKNGNMAYEAVAAQAKKEIDLRTK